MSQTYSQPLATLVRVWRWLYHRCVVCGHRTGRSYLSNLRRFLCGDQATHYRYCCMECAMYDGVMSARANPNLPKPRILTGKTTWKYFEKENWN